MTDEYDKGLMAGRLQALEKDMRNLSHDMQEIVKTIKYMERVLWMLIGAGVFLNVWPAVKALLGQ